MNVVVRKFPVLKWAGVTGVGVLLLFGATASASIPAQNGTIYGCYANSNGATRIIDPGKSKCGPTEKPISWSQRGPAGARGPAGPKGNPGTPGVPGVSGYEQVYPDSQTVSLPIDATIYYANCPTGKKVFSGGVIVTLYDDSGFVETGSPARYSVPNGGEQWAALIVQPAVDGATKATISFRLVCAVAAP